MVKYSSVCFLLSCIICINAYGQLNQINKNLIIKLEPNEKWWGGAVSEAHKGPFGAFPYAINLLGDNKGNQAQPLLISNHGRYVWSSKPFAFSFQHDTLLI